MKEAKAQALPLFNQIFYAFGSLAFTLLERLIILYAIFYFLPPKELGLHNLVSDRTFFGIITITGTALLLGRVFDGLSDPLIATLSDNNRSRVGRRKLFLLYSGLPLALTTFLVFLPPQPAQESLLNGLWLAVMMCLFSIAFTAYVNPFLALMSELGHTGALRINKYLHLHGFIRAFGDGLHYRLIPSADYSARERGDGAAPGLPRLSRRICRFLRNNSLPGHPCLR